MTSKIADTAGPSGANAVEHRLKAESLIKNYVMAASAASIVPIPLFDLAAVTAVQMRMIQKLAEMYGKTFSEAPVRNTVVSLAGGILGPTAGAITAASFAKLIPGIGWMIGAASMPVMVGASTYAVGKVFLKHFEEGGSIYDISVGNMRSYYGEQFGKGKTVAKQATPAEQATV